MENTALHEVELHTDTRPVLTFLSDRFGNANGATLSGRAALVRFNLQAPQVHALTNRLPTPCLENENTFLVGLEADRFPTGGQLGICITLGIPDARLGQRLTRLVRCRNGRLHRAKRLSPDDGGADWKENFAPHAVPFLRIATCLSNLVLPPGSCRLLCDLTNHDRVIALVLLDLDQAGAAADISCRMADPALRRAPSHHERLAARTRLTWRYTPGTIDPDLLPGRAVPFTQPPEPVSPRLPG